MPRRHWSLKLVCTAALFFLLAASAGGASPSHQLLMAVSEDQGEHVGDVIGYVKDGKIFAIPNQNYYKFVAAYFKDRQYTYYSAGKPLGVVTATGRWRDQDPCGPYEAALSPDKSMSPSSASWGLASDVDFKDAGYTRRDATDAEKAAFRKLASNLYAWEKVPQAVYDKARIFSLAVLEKDQQVLLVGGLRVDVPITVAGAERDTDSVFLIAESGSNGQLKTTFTWYNSGSENTRVDRDFVDALDIDGDGIPEIVAESSYYEGTGYTIYKKTDHGWRKVFDYQYGC